MHLISWNLNKQPDLLKAALDHAATLPCVILAIQEVPHMGKRPKKLTSLPLGELTTTTLVKLGLERKLQILGSHKNQWRSIALVASPSIIKIGEPRNDGDKMLAATVEVMGYGRFDVITLHAISQWTKTKEQDRYDSAQALRRSLNQLWKSPDVVVLGDFNAEPFHAEMWGHTKLYALRDQQMVQHHTNQPKNAGNFPLYNPAWAMLTESRTNGQPAGTYRYKELQYSHWLTLDYCLLSSGLMGRFREISVLSKIGNIELMKQGGDTIRIGDHLPVQALLNP